MPLLATVYLGMWSLSEILKTTRSVVDLRLAWWPALISNSTGPGQTWFTGSEW